MTEQQLLRIARRRLAILRHAEEITGNVSLTCRYYGISRQCFYTWRRRYDAHGLVREVLEETGLVVEPDYLTGVYKNMRHGIVALVFRCHVVSGQPTPTAEASQVSWLTPDQVEQLMNEAYATRLLDALQPGPPSVRIHDGVALLPS